ncbi:MAG: LacI family DNA-binding transcriptional regulator [Opitutales bacterium]|nr:LacI family DNA-binding transcriptional regulator [Opitutales bacterium]
MAKVGAANMREVAAAAGVSHITVSRVLRNDPRVAAATRERVLAKGRELGYAANPLVSAYAAHIRRRTGEAPACNLAWLTATPEHHAAGYFPWVRPYLEGARARAAAQGFPLATDIETHGARMETVERILRARGIRGIIVPNIHYYGPELTASPHWAAVSLGNSAGGKPIHTVRPNAFENVRIAFDHLLATGRQRIGFCENRYMAVQGRGLHEGGYLYQQRRLNTRDRLPPLTDLHVEPRRAECLERFRKWYERHRPEAILTTFFQVADWLRELGLRVPRDVALTHLAIAEENSPMAGVNVGARELGSAAVDLLAAHILRNEYGPPANPKHMSITGYWQDGRTV